MTGIVSYQSAVFDGDSEASKGLVLRKLRDILAALYPDRTSMKRICSDAEIKVSLIEFGDIAINNWHSILSEAEKTERMERLLEIVLCEYSSNSEFVSAIEEYRKQSSQNHPEQTSSDHTQSKGTQKITKIKATGQPSRSPLERLPNYVWWVLGLFFLAMTLMVVWFGGQNVDGLSIFVKGEDGQPINRAKVKIESSNAPDYAYTDVNGFTRFENIEQHIPFKLIIEAKGFELYEETIDRKPNSKKKEIELKPHGENISSLPLQPATITTHTFTQTLVPAVPPTSTFTRTPVPTLPPTPNPTQIALATLLPTPDSQFISITRVTENNTQQVWVPPGSFIAGSEVNPYPDSKPLHQVYTDGFWIDQFLVTTDQYAKCAQTSVCRPPADNKSHKREETGYYGNPVYADYPVIEVTWSQAIDYCRWRGARLPTEAEFEKAAGWNPRTATMQLYPWGDNPPNEDLANYQNDDRDTTSFDKYPQGVSPIGAYDMAGNVWQWVMDWYGETYYQENTDWINPMGPANGRKRVVRGGSWSSKTEIPYLQVANRGTDDPMMPTNEKGFRCVNEENSEIQRSMLSQEGSVASVLGTATVINALESALPTPIPTNTPIPLPTTVQTSNLIETDDNLCQPQTADQVAQEGWSEKRELPKITPDGWDVEVFGQASSLAVIGGCARFWGWIDRFPGGPHANHALEICNMKLDMGNYAPKTCNGWNDRIKEVQVKCEGQPITIKIWQDEFYREPPAPFEQIFCN